MKKYFLLITLVIASMSASAQVYLGGSLGFSTKAKGSSFYVTPELGYAINDMWSVGAYMNVEGSGGQALKWTATWDVNPYVRYTFLNTRIVSCFLDGKMGFSTRNGARELDFGICPGVKVALGNNWKLMSRLGYFGWTNAGNGKYALSADLAITSVGLFYEF